MRSEKMYTIFLLPSGNVSSKNALVLEEDLISSGYNILEIYLLLIFSKVFLSIFYKKRCNGSSEAALMSVADPFLVDVGELE